MHIYIWYWHRRLGRCFQLGGATENFRHLNTPFLSEHSCSFFSVLGEAFLENCGKSGYMMIILLRPRGICWHRQPHLMTTGSFTHSASYSMDLGHVLFPRGLCTCSPPNWNTISSPLHLDSPCLSAEFGIGITFGKSLIEWIWSSLELHKILVYLLSLSVSHNKWSVSLYLSLTSCSSQFMGPIIILTINTIITITLTICQAFHKH